MNRFLILSLLLSTSTLFANDNEESYLCANEELGKTVVMKKLSAFEDLKDDKNWERKARYSISIQTTELPFPDFVSEGDAYGVDVEFLFKADNQYDSQNVTFRMYLDELDQSTLYLDYNSYDYTCKTFSEVFGN